MTAAPAVDVRLGPDHAAKALRHDVETGLDASPKWLPPKWFYDARGSDLFEQITRLPEYYPTRAEAAALRGAVAEIARVTGARTVVELGAGSSEKTRMLLDALSGDGARTGALETFVPQDVSESALRATVDAVAAAYPALRVHGVVSDFTADLGPLPGASPRLVAFLGGTIGNFLPAERAGFLSAVSAVLDPGEWLLLGADLVKAADVLVPAYDDAAGVTAEFNRNVLRVVNRELDADFDVDAFEHVAVWDAQREWVEMRLRATRAMRVTVGALQRTFELAAGEHIRTEVSAKFREPGLRAELASAGLDVTGWWTDPEGRFGLALARRSAR
jgi:L-histidine Nalpha-methyltransferase